MLCVLCVSQGQSAKGCRMIREERRRIAVRAARDEERGACPVWRQRCAVARKRCGRRGRLQRRAQVGTEGERRGKARISPRRQKRKGGIEESGRKRDRYGLRAEEEGEALEKENRERERERERKERERETKEREREKREGEAQDVGGNWSAATIVQIEPPERAR